MPSATPPMSSRCRCSAWSTRCTRRSTRRAATISFAEFYADLDYRDDGSLIITREHEAKDPDEAAAKCLRAITEGKVKSVGGKDVAVGAATICVHSDTPNAVAIAEAVREAVSPYLDAA